MLDGHLLIDAHVHVPVLSSLKPAWIDWAREFGPSGILEDLWDADGTPRPARLDELFEEQGVDVALLLCEYSPRATGIQRFEDLLPIVEHNPSRFRPVANVNPHLHYPIAEEVARQLDLGAAALKLHPVHGGFRCDDAALYPAYQVLSERGVPLVVHCGTSSFPGSMNELADPEFLLPVLRDFPTLDVVLAHGGRGWWYDKAAFLAQSQEHVWIELSGLPPKRLPSYFARFDVGRLARRWIFGTDWPGVPSTSENARAVVALGLDDDTAAAVLGGNARRVYSGLDAPRGHPVSDEPSSGRPPAELSDAELETQGKQLHDTRNWMFLHGSAAQFATHTERMLELEQEYLRRHPHRTWQGTAPGEDAEPEEPADPVGALLGAVAEAPGGRLHKLEVHQLARRFGLDRAALAALYTQEPQLLATDRSDRVITEAGRDRIR